MTKEALTYIKNRLAAAGIPYSFGEWTGSTDDYYFTGNYLETPTLTREENGRQQSTFILMGYTRKSWMVLEEAKSVIESVLPVCDILPDGSGLCIMYDSATHAPMADGSKCIKIDFAIDEWRVNI